MIRTLLITHAHMRRRETSKEALAAFPVHTPLGNIKMRELIGAAITRIDNDKEGSGLAIAGHGFGIKFEQIYLELIQQAGSKYPHLRSYPCIDLVMGVSVTVLSQRDIAITDMGKCYPASSVTPPKKYISVKRAWKFIREIEADAKKIAPNSYVVLCGGRQCMTMLGKRNKFQIASVFELDSSRGEVECIFKSDES